MAWYEKWAIMVIASVIGVAGYNGIPWSKMGIAEWAYWVGALGSIGSIIGAYFLGERQSKAAFRLAANAEQLAAYRRGKAILAVVDAAHSHTSGVMGAFNKDGFDYLILLMNYDDETMKNLTDALAAIPVHELGSYRGVAAILRLRNSMVYFRKHINRCITQVEERESRNPETDGVGDFHPFDTAALEICMKEIGKCKLVLVGEVEKMRVSGLDH